MFPAQDELPATPASVQRFEVAPDDHFYTFEAEDPQFSKSLIALRQQHGPDEQKIAEALIASGYTWEVAGNAGRFQGIDQQNLVDKLLYRSGYTVTSNFDQFTEIDRQNVTDQLLADGYCQEVIANFEKFSGVNSKIVAERALEDGYGHDLAANYEKFPGLDDQEIADKLIVRGYSASLLANFEKFSGADAHRVMNSMIEHDAIRPLFSRYSDVLGLDQTTVLDRVVAQGKLHQIGQNLYAFSNLGEEIGIKLITSGFVEDVIFYIEQFDSKARSAMAHRLIADGHAPEMMYRFSAFNLPATDEQAWELINAGATASVIENIGIFDITDKKKIADHAIQTGCLDSLAGVIEEFKDVMTLPSQIIFDEMEQGRLSYRSAWQLRSNIDYVADHKYLARLFETMGENGSYGTIHDFESLREGDISQALSLLGVDKTGPAGIEQATQLFESLKASIFKPTRELLVFAIKNGAMQAMMKEYYRLSEGSYFANDRQLIEKLKTSLANFDKHQLKDGFEDSEIYYIHSTSAKEKKIRLDIDEDAINRYQRLRQQLMSAVEHVQTMSKGQTPYQAPITQILDYLGAKQESLLARREQIGDSAKQQKQLIGIEVQTTKINGVQTRGVEALEHLEENFMMLADEKKLADIVLPILFARVLRLDQTLTATERKAKFEAASTTISALPEQPELEDLNTLVSLMEHISGNGAYQTLFSTPEAQQKMMKLASVESLKLAITKLSQRKGNIPLQFQPSRGLLLELSGHIGDACWANTYEDIATRFPNFTAVTIRRSPGEKNDRLVGSFLLIETKSAETGDPMLVIRGLNPIENFINSVDVEEFFEAAVDYTTKTAAKLGAKVGISIDDHSGGHGTNRPVIHGYLTRLASELTQRKVPEDGTTFNGYYIANEVFEISH